MTHGDQERTHPHGFTKTNMRIMFVVAAVGSVLVVAFGIYDVAAGNSGSKVLVIVGGILLALLGIIFPLALRRGRM